MWPSLSVLAEQSLSAGTSLNISWKNNKDYYYLNNIKSLF
jgi:hypothetical protein